MRALVTMAALTLAAVAVEPAPASAQSVDAGPRAAPRARDAGPRRARRDAGPRRRRPRDAGSPELDAGVALDPLDAGVPFDSFDAALDASTDAGPPDAGFEPDAWVEPDAYVSEPDAGPPPPPEPERATQDPWAVINELLFERRRREETPPREVTPSPSASPTTVVNTPRDVDVNIVGCEARPELFGLGFPERRMSTFGLLLLLGLALMMVWAMDRARRPLPSAGMLPRALGLVHLGARLAAVIIVIMLASRLLPAWLRPALLLTIAAVAVTIGFGAVWTVLPDVIGGIILVTERRMKPGLFITGEGFRGTLVQIGPRVTTLRALDGTDVTVPNRTIVKSRVASSTRRWHEIEVELAVPPGFDAPRVRRAIQDAVLASPHVPPSPGLVVSRDPTQPDRWRVTARLVDARFGPAFEGQLLERVEEALEGDDVEDAPATS